MLSQILTHNKKKKFLTRLAALEKEKENLKNDNVAFVEHFDIQKLTEEVNNMSWNVSLSSQLRYSCYSMKNLISISNNVVTGGSEFLADYVSPFSASIFQQLKKLGAVNVLNANLDEFGLAGTGLDSFFKGIPNPLNPKHIIGGSSSGSAYLVAKQLVDFSIGTDTGDSVRVPASYTNIYGYKPSYGLISRFGVFPYCPSFDTVSIMANSVEDISIVMSHISFPDPKDLTTINTVQKSYQKNLNKAFSEPIRIAVFKNTFWSKNARTEDSEKIEKEFKNTVEKISANKMFIVEEIVFEEELLKLFELIYQVVSFAESISSYANLNGMLFPFSETQEKKIKPTNFKGSDNYHNLLINSRKKLGKEFKFRQVLGRHFLNGDNYLNVYIKAKKLLTIIQEKTKKLFENYDAVISPTTNSIPDKIDEVKKKYDPCNIKNIVLLANFCGLPAISIPWIFVKQLPVGFHILSRHNDDELLLRIAHFFKKNKLV